MSYHQIHFTFIFLQEFCIVHLIKNSKFFSTNNKNTFKDTIKYFVRRKSPI